MPLKITSATRKEITKPLTSTSVATKGAEALAGSSRSFYSTKGSIEPAIEPKVTMPISAAKTVRPTSCQCGP